jgi:hypothetical protein
MVTPKASRPQSSSSAPSVLPPEPMERGRAPQRAASGTWRSSFKAVGGRKALRTPCSRIRVSANSGSNFTMRCASTGTP